MTHDRRYFGWYALNVLESPPRLIALELLVRTTYGHPDARLARDRVREAFRTAPAAPVPISNVA